MGTITIKGSLSLDKGLILTFGNVIASLILLYQIILPDVPVDSAKYEELVVATVAMFGLSVLFYWLWTMDYYYYELYNDRIVVKNLLKPYLKELPLSTLQYVDLRGDLATSRWSANSLEFIYQYNDSRKNFQYSSINYGQDDWLRLIKEFKKLDIDTRDPYKRFFKGDHME